jgi:uncharacterized membrane protein YozB (DUF420 family)
VLTGPLVILILKSAVGAVTVLLLASLVALSMGNIRLHGRINLAFFVLTLIALLGFELVIRVINPEVFRYIDENEVLRRALNIHLCFAVPSAVLMPVMLYTGLKRHLFRWPVQRPVDRHVCHRGLFPATLNDDVARNVNNWFSQARWSRTSASTSPRRPNADGSRASPYAIQCPT